MNAVLAIKMVAALGMLDPNLDQVDVVHSDGRVTHIYLVEDNEPRATMAEPEDDEE